MKWKKLGKIFDPVNYKLANGCIDYAQSPQALVFDDFVRIYFSTRYPDKPGYFVSHISYVEMDKNFSKVLKVSEKPVIEMGKTGCFDEHGIFPLNIVKDNDKILGYIGGWSRKVSVSIETSIGLAISSDDGLTFHRIGDGPVLTSSLYEPFLVGDPFVAIFNNTYHLWYIYGTRWINFPDDKDPQRVYKIGHALSHDGINWLKTGKQIIPDKLNVDECQALPTVIEYKGKYHMYFCYREVIGFRKISSKAYRIGYAYSNDLLNWVRDDANVGIDVSKDDWDSDMLCYPHVFHCDDKVLMLYNGNQFGRYGFGLAVLED
jgi:predicted GH43/DUF377 family glycosyl hydrolase